MIGKPHIQILETLPICDYVLCRYYQENKLMEARKKVGYGSIYSEVDKFVKEIKSGKVIGKEITL